MTVDCQKYNTEKLKLMCMFLVELSNECFGHFR